MYTAALMRRIFALAALVSASCGSDSAPPTAADYCETIEPFFCDFYVRCGRMDVATVDECKPAFLESCNAVFEPRYVDLEAAGLLELDADGIAACREHLETVACDQQFLELTGPCATMWRGTQPAGAACGLDVESFVCAPGNECVLSVDLCGDCRPIVAVGATCTPGTDTCGAEAFCDAGTCRARVGNGDACTPDDRCLTGAFCDNGVCTSPQYVAAGDACDQLHRCPYLTACMNGTCQSTASVADACSSDAECELGFCDATTCAVPRPNGESCDRAAQCSSGLCDGGACQPRPSACIAP
jgi:hypothetical protein